MLPVLSLVVVLQLSNLASAPPPVVANAQDEVVRLYSAIGVPVRWQSPASPTDAHAIRVVLLPLETGDLRRMNDTVMGAAVRTDEGTSVAYVFYKRVQQEADRYTVSSALVLACAMAHELGHLLLSPSREHAADGLMRAYWRRAEFLQAGQRRLSFSVDESDRIRAQLADLRTLAEHDGGPGARPELH